MPRACSASNASSTWRSILIASAAFIAPDPRRSAQRAAFQKLQHQVEVGALLEHIKNLTDSRMTHARQRSRFAPQPGLSLGALGRPAQSLDGNMASEARVPALEHNTHAALADLTTDLVLGDSLQHNEDPTPCYS